MEILRYVNTGRVPEVTRGSGHPFRCRFRMRPILILFGGNTDNEGKEVSGLRNGGLLDLGNTHFSVLRNEYPYLGFSFRAFMVVAEHNISLDILLFRIIVVKKKMLQVNEHGMPLLLKGNRNRRRGSGATIGRTYRGATPGKRKVKIDERDAKTRRRKHA
jgi:hypothetical protein